MEENPLNSLTDGITNLIGTPIGAATAGAIGGVVVGAGVGALAATAISKSRKKRSSKSKRKKNSRSGNRRRRKYYPRTAGKAKDRSTKRIRYTKKGQPYVIKANGRAMFIKKSSAKKSRKLKGGRY